jgi:hypothetical protein
VRAIQIEHGSTDGAEGNAGCKSLNGAGGDQCHDGICRNENQQCHDIQDQRREHHGPATDIIRQSPDRQQRNQQTERIGGEHRRDHDRREVPVVLIDPVEWCRCAGEHGDSAERCDLKNNGSATRHHAFRPGVEIAGHRGRDLMDKVGQAQWSLPSLIDFTAVQCSLR